jgi:hypothetical protein
MFNEPKVSEVLVTPERAKEILKKNTSNRRVKEASVTRYANDMKAGRWRSGTYELIKISKTGRVLDGQHRLHAVIKSGVSVLFHIVHGLEEDLFSVLDTGSVRNASDIFKIAGIPNETVIPSIIQTFTSLQADILDPYAVAKQNRLTNAQLLAEYQKHPESWQIVARKTMLWYTQFAKLLYPSQIGGAYAHFSTIDKEQAESFFSQLTSGFAVENNTIVRLRNVYTADWTATKKMSAATKMALLIKTWNAFRTKKEIKLLRFDPERESYPKAA